MTDERKQVLELLAELSTLYPDTRMGQWITSFASSARGAKIESIYDVEDEELIPVMRKFLATRREAAKPPQELKQGA
jgi:hypothetical protein